MLRYVVKKLLLAIPTLLILAVTIFALMRAIPGDPAMMMVGDMADPAMVEQARREMGLDKPLPAQFLIWFGDVLHGDFGTSRLTGQEVLASMLSRFSVTAQVVLVAVVLAMAVAVPAGIYAAWRQNRPGDFAVVLVANVFLSVPSFWMGMLLILLFGVTLQWLPTIGYVSAGANAFAAAKYLAMPVLSLVFIEVATITRMMRASTIEVLRQEYVTHARAKGLGEGAVLCRHVLKNALAPTATLIGLILGSLLGGAAVVETVFSLPGLGRFLVDAIYARDYAVVQGVLILVSAIYLAVNLLVDLAYPLLDPRVRL